jgi:hypothetical protein
MFRDDDKVRAGYYSNENTVDCVKCPYFRLVYSGAYDLKTLKDGKLTVGDWHDCLAGKCHANGLYNGNRDYIVAKSQCPVERGKKNLPGGI